MVGTTQKMPEIMIKVWHQKQTVLTAMIDVKSISKEAGQSVSVFTCDQPIYRVALNIIWANTIRWTNFYPRISGMH